VAAGTRASATFLAKADGVVAGLAVVDAVRGNTRADVLCRTQPACVEPRRPVRWSD